MMDIDLKYITNIFARADQLAKRTAMLLARGYHEGKQTVYLNDRMKEFLELHDEVSFRINIIQSINNALRDELIVKGFKTDEPDGAKKQEQWANDLWKNLRMDAIQTRTHEAAVADGAGYIIVDYNEGLKSPDMTLHRGYVEPTVSITGNVELVGDGLGCWMVYQNNDLDQPPLAAVKQWTETYLDEGAYKTRDRMTIYYPERIERYVKQLDGWTPILDGEGNFPQAWVDKSGKPLGIPVIPFFSPNMTPEAWEAMTIQDAVNKTNVDMLGAADSLGFPLFKAFGFHPTTDGQPRKDDNSNLWKISPLMVLGSTKPPSEASLDVIPAQPATALMDVIINLILFAAQITSTPVSRFTTTKQIASADTLKEQDRLLVKKAMIRKVTFGDAWEDCLVMARRLANTFGGESMNEEIHFETEWAKSESEMAIERADKDKELQDKKLVWDTVASVMQSTQGMVAPETVLRNFGWADAEIVKFKADRRASISDANADEPPIDPVTGERMTQ